MFNVGRFDPKKEFNKTGEGQVDNPHPRNTDDVRKSTKRRRNKGERASKIISEGALETNPYIVAPEAKGPVSKTSKRGRIHDEAFDDMELEDIEIEGNKDHPTTGQPQSGPNDHDVSDPSPEEIRNAIYMSSLPIQDAAKKWNLAPFLVKNLEQERYENFFPIQALVIPDIIASERYSYIRAQDICVAAPTGSGKTLAFVIPILNSLAGRKIKRLRALVVLPSRDLAQQVYDVFQFYATGSDLAIGLAIGQSDFKAEQVALTVDGTCQIPASMGGINLQAAKQRCILDPGNTSHLIDAFSSLEALNWNKSEAILKGDIPRGGRSAVDVLVCSPGRLVDHLDNTPGFTLQHLHFMVVDEADRLTGQTYHNWIGRVLDAANTGSVATWNEIQDARPINNHKVPPLRDAPNGCSYDLDMVTWRRGGTLGDESSFNTNESDVVASVCRPVQLRKLLYSATMTKDPQKLAGLHLVNPKFFDARYLMESEAGKGSKRYSMPSQLLEYTVECTAEQKPIVLLALLLERLQSAPKEVSNKKSIIVVFTSSLESTHRLSRLLQLLWKAAGYGDSKAIAEFSSSLSQKERSHLVKRCNNPDDNISVVVCSDGMSRGMDIRLVGTVINYDVPSFAKTYCHRCGRTARAGREGVAISLLKIGQVKQFSRMRQLIDSADRIESMGVKKALVRDAVSVYKACLKKLADVVAAEEDGDLSPTDTIPAEFFP